MKVSAFCIVNFLFLQKILKNEDLYFQKKWQLTAYKFVQNFYFFFTIHLITLFIYHFFSYNYFEMPHFWFGAHPKPRGVYKFLFPHVSTMRHRAAWKNHTSFFLIHFLLPIISKTSKNDESHIYMCVLCVNSDKNL